MNFIQRVKRGFKAFMNRDTADLSDQELLGWLGINNTDQDAISEVTYYTCLKMLSETIGKLPLKYYQQTERGRMRAEPTTATILMTLRPNPYMTPTVLWTGVERNCQMYGNGYIYIRKQFIRDNYGGRLIFKDMWLMPSQYVSVLFDNQGIFRDDSGSRIFYQFTDPKTGEIYLFRSNEVMHFKTWYSTDGITGQSVADILSDTVGGAKESQNYLNRLYKQGLTASMALQYTGDLDEARRRKLERKFGEAMTGARNAGRVVPVPIGLQLTPLNMTMADAQFMELKKYSALQIAGAFGIKPNQINNYDKSSYSNSETQQLAFLVDTMMYRLKAYEDEINAKVLTEDEIKGRYFYKFNEKAILRTDSKTQMENLSKGVNNGIYTPNEAREYLDMPSEEGGDKLIVNGNYIPLTRVGDQYEKGGEDGGGY